MNEILRPSLQAILPELTITLFIILVLLADLVYPGDEEYEEVRGSDTVALMGVTFALIVTIWFFPGQNSEEIFRNVLVVDPFSQFIKLLLLLSTWVAILYSYQTPEVTTPRRAEYYVYLLGLVLGGMFLASGNDLLIFYLSFETLGICSYILAGHMRGSFRSTEAGFKYVLYGAASSGILLFGLTYLYGMTGTTLLNGSLTSGGGIVDILSQRISHAVAPAMASPLGAGQAMVVPLSLLPLPLFMILAGMLYKVAGFPLHFWCPDVYEGSPLPVTGIFSVLVKAAGFSFMIRFFYSMFFAVNAHDVAAEFPGFVCLMGFIAAFTMTVGNFSALAQTNIKRLLAYSGIANCGYILMAFSLLNSGVGHGPATGNQPEGVTALLFFLMVYTFANLGVFVVAIAIADHLGIEEIEGYQGLGRLAPVLGVGMAIFVFSLVGIPPMAGFVGKFYLIYAVVQQGTEYATAALTAAHPAALSSMSTSLYMLAICAVLNSVVSLFYYARILKAMFLKEPPAGVQLEVSGLYRVLVVMLAVPVLVLGVWFGPAIGFAAQAARCFLP